MNSRSIFFFPLTSYMSCAGLYHNHHLFVMLSSFFSYSFVDQPIMLSFSTLTCLLRLSICRVRHWFQNSRLGANKFIWFPLFSFPSRRLSY
ncbi:hypothetical protein EDD16DRAFT_1572768 [Pisolithus croceorrhizus]|nr:hypothetical protein EDD16DRAFT_1572768 [Pisolithus croceorrhizus]